MADTIVPTFVSSTSFTCPINAESLLPANLMILCEQGVDGDVVAQVESSSYSAGSGLTTVIVTSAVLTSHLTSVWLSYVSPESIPAHTHAGILNIKTAAWTNAGLEFEAFDLQIHNGSGYLCILGHTSAAENEPGTGGGATYWLRLFSKGDPGEEYSGPPPLDGSSFVWRGYWNTSVEYVEGNCVYNRGCTWICTDDHESASETEPGEGASFDTVWDVMTKGIIPKGAWALGVMYGTDGSPDLVTRGGASYLALGYHEATADKAPGTGASWETWWQCIAEKGLPGDGVQEDGSLLLEEIATPAGDDLPPAGYHKLYPKSDHEFYRIDHNGLERVLGGEGSGSGDSVKKEIIQEGHSFAAGDLVSIGGDGLFYLTDLTTMGGPHIAGIVESVDGDAFTVVQEGFITLPVGLDLDAGTLYYASGTVPGGLHYNPQAAPAASASLLDIPTIPVLITITATTGIVLSPVAFYLQGYNSFFNSPQILLPRLGAVNSGIQLEPGTAYFCYVGALDVSLPEIVFVEFYVSIGGTGAQTVAEIGVFAGLPPCKDSQSLEKIAVSDVLDDLTTTGVKRNTTSLSDSESVFIPAFTDIWLGIRVVMASTQPTILGLGNDYGQGFVLKTDSAAAFSTAGPWTGALITPVTGAVAPDLRLAMVQGVAPTT